MEGWRKEAPFAVLEAQNGPGRGWVVVQGALGVGKAGKRVSGRNGAEKGGGWSGMAGGLGERREWRVIVQGGRKGWESRRIRAPVWGR